jgi:hypothetical protein
VFGFEVVQLSKVSLLLRKGGEHTYVVVETGNEDHKMSVMNHNGIDIGSPEEVDRAHATLTVAKDEYRIRQIHPVRYQHGVYSMLPAGPGRELVGDLGEPAKRLQLRL